MPGVMRALTQHCGGTVTAPPMPCASPPQPSFQPPICFPPPSSAFYPHLTLSTGSCTPAFSIFYKLFSGGRGKGREPSRSILGASHRGTHVFSLSQPHSVLVLSPLLSLLLKPLLPTSPGAALWLDAAVTSAPSAATLVALRCLSLATHALSRIAPVCWRLPTWSPPSRTCFHVRSFCPPTRMFSQVPPTQRDQKKPRPLAARHARSHHKVGERRQF